jgi:hypothetical protein
MHLNGHNCPFQVVINEILRPVVHLFEAVSSFAYASEIGYTLPILLQQSVDVAPLEIKSFRKLSDRNFLIEVKMLNFLNQLQATILFG